MNRGRHKKQSFPYGEYVNMEIIYFNGHPKVQRRSLILDYVKFEDKSSLNYKIIKWMTDKYYRILEIKIRYNQKIIRVYKKHEFYNKLYEQKNEPWQT